MSWPNAKIVEGPVEELIEAPVHKPVPEIIEIPIAQPTSTHQAKREEYLLKFIECGHSVHSWIPASASTTTSNSHPNSRSVAYRNTQSAALPFARVTPAATAPRRARFPDPSVIPVPGRCPTCQSTDSLWAQAKLARDLVPPP